MKQLQAIGISGGTAVGLIHVLPKDHLDPPPAHPCIPSQELAAFHLACTQAKQQLFDLEQKALNQVGREGADIFRIHAMLLDDQDLLQATEDFIETGLAAHQAIIQAGAQFAQALLELKDDYLSARAADVEEVARHVSALLTPGQHSAPPPEGCVLLAAETLGVGTLVRWGRERLLGLILTHCPSTCHTAILARAMGLPVVSGLSPQCDWQGHNAAVDADQGLVWLDPDQRTIAQLNAAVTLPQHLPHLPARTRNGHHVTILANLSHPCQCAQALTLGAEGVGLFRSEFLFLGRDTPPDEQEQYQCYRQLLEAMDKRCVVVRTLDGGSDKPLPYLKLPFEENPALGCRGIRLSLAHTDLFCTQLRALLRASAHGKLSVLLPMVTDVEQVRSVKALLEQCGQALRARGVSMGIPELGVMIETPAAALLSHQLAREVSFFSIGTNDLTQYTLASDRSNDQPSSAGHPAVMALIQMAVEGGHAHGCRVCVCGEMAGALDLTQPLLELGVDELSVAPSRLPVLRQHIRSLPLSSYN